MNRARQGMRRKAVFVSLLMFPLVFYYLSPVLILMGASEGLLTGSAIVFTGLFVTGLFTGRAWCGWACPAGGLQEQCARVRDVRAKGGWRNHIKWVVWVPWMAMLFLLFIGAGGVETVDPFYQTWHGISIGSIQSLVLFTMIAGAIALVAMTGGRRAFCHYLCWIGPFTILASRVRDVLRLPGIRLASDKEMCVGCGTCTRNCPMSLDVEAMVDGGRMTSSECILCGTCVDGCPKGAITYLIGRPVDGGGNATDAPSTTTSGS